MKLWLIAQWGEQDGEDLCFLVRGKDLDTATALVDDFLRTNPSLVLCEENLETAADYAVMLGEDSKGGRARILIGPFRGLAYNPMKYLSWRRDLDQARSWKANIPFWMTPSVISEEDFKRLMQYNTDNPDSPLGRLKIKPRSIPLRKKTPEEKT